MSVTESPSVENAAKKILIVDDDVKMAKALRTVLKDAGFATSLCHAGTHALDYARREQPDAALIDVHLPDVSGLILVQQLRQILGATTPLIMVSGDTSMETLNSLSHVGATYFFSKPMNAVSLIGHLREWLA